MKKQPMLTSALLNQVFGNAVLKEVNRANEVWMYTSKNITTPFLQ